MHPGESLNSATNKANRNREGGSESVAEIAGRLRIAEDYNMALALQEQEFSHHYNHNRTERRTIGNDIRLSVEQQLEEERKVAAQVNEISKRDEELARELQQELEEKELHLMRADEDLARRLQQEEEQQQSTSLSASGIRPITHFTADAPASFRCEGGNELARSLQERYYQRYNRNVPKRRPLDENTENAMNILVDSNLISTSTAARQPHSANNNSDTSH